MRQLTIPIILAAALPLVFSATASAQTVQSSASDDTDGAVSSNDDKIICKREKVAGSRLTSKKVCLTAAEWERLRRDDQQMTEKIQSARWKNE